MGRNIARPDYLLLTALRFESRIGRRLGLKRQGPEDAHSPLSKCTIYQGQVGGHRVMLAEIGMGAVVLQGNTGISEALAACAPKHGVLSVGLAGGLSPGLKGGTVFTCEKVAWSGTDWPAGTALTDRLAKAGAKPIETLVTANSVVSTTDGKKQLAVLHNAQAVDMESGIIAQWAQEHGIPFAVLRGISDTADSPLPAIIQDGQSPLKRFLSIPKVIPLACRSLAARQRIVKILRGLLGVFLGSFLWGFLGGLL